jgi:hypothetical protein
VLATCWKLLSKYGDFSLFSSKYGDFGTYFPKRTAIFLVAKWGNFALKKNAGENLM